MTTESSGELTPREEEAFKKLSREEMPPDSVEEAVITGLREKRLLKSNTFFSLANHRMPVFRFAVSVVAACLLLGMGFAAGLVYLDSKAPFQSKSQFALLILNDEVSAKDDMALASEYINWMKNIGASGKLISGEELFDGGKILRSRDGQLKVSDIAIDGRYGHVGGFFLVEAGNYDDAVNIASTCPHLEYQGSIEVRQIHTR